MVYTIKDGEEWEYLSVLNTCIKILLTVGIGFVGTRLHILEPKDFIPQAVKFVFYISLPSLVVLGLGVNIDIYDDSFLWEFIAAFLVLRVVALIVAFAIVLGSRNKQGIGEVTVNWLALSWISTIILGVPIASAVFDDPKVGVTYGIMAGISSFIFQLPLQLLFLEYYQLERDPARKTPTDIEAATENGATGSQHDTMKDDRELHDSPRSTEMEEIPVDDYESPGAPQKPQTHDKESDLARFMHFASQNHVWVDIGGKVLKNPVLWAIAWGFFLTLSTIGPKYLRSTSDDYVPGLGWFPETLKWLGDCVSPVSLVAMGAFVSEQGKGVFKVSFKTLLFMICKLVLTPLLMLGLLEAFGMDDIPGRAGILISALPISMASYSLASRYKIGEDFLSQNVVLGTFLILPTIIFWNLALDAAGVFPIPE